MAPRQSRKTRADTSEAASDVETQQSSMDTMEADWMKTAQDMIASSRRRREAKRAAIEGEHAKRIKDAKAQIDTLFENRKMRVTKAQKTQWDRLAALNKKRQELESQILASMALIERHTANISSELVAVLTGRVEDFQKTQESSNDEKAG